ncbi:hypothetical protein PUN28_004295 [Cardiocondyla obscurior]|uniref:Uncharacterized protein n=1 Tax=Cardiocondyla obscurior TaxID=286306 RepID=A0AAW2GBR4_9HYME
MCHVGSHCVEGRNDFIANLFDSAFRHVFDSRFNQNGQEHRLVERLELPVLAEEAPLKVRVTPLPKIRHTPAHSTAGAKNTVRSENKQYK